MSADSEIIAFQEGRIAELEDSLQFVERWAVHHGTKSHMTAENALSIIQHYPPIAAITKSYADGKVPETFNPYARITELEAQLADAKAEVKKYQWQPVDSGLPQSGGTVLACYKNNHGNLRRIRAQWIAAKSCESSEDFDFGEYDEASDTYYDPEGWYEQIDNAVDYSAMLVSEEVTHWMPLPAAPSIQAEGKQA